MGASERVRKKAGTFNAMQWMSIWTKRQEQEIRKEQTPMPQTDDLKYNDSGLRPRISAVQYTKKKSGEELGIACFYFRSRNINIPAQ